MFSTQTLNFGHFTWSQAFLLPGGIMGGGRRRGGGGEGGGVEDVVSKVEQILNEVQQNQHILSTSHGTYI